MVCVGQWDVCVCCVVLPCVLCVINMRVCKCVRYACGVFVCVVDLSACLCGCMCVRGDIRFVCDTGHVWRDYDAGMLG